jgi:hypothetical protein
LEAAADPDITMTGTAPQIPDPTAETPAAVLHREEVPVIQVIPGVPVIQEAAEAVEQPEATDNLIYKIF